MAETSPAPETPVAPAAPGLQHLPVTLFAVLMGLFGLTLAFRAASHEGFAWAEPAGVVTLWVGIATLAVIALAYLAKSLRHPKAVAAEWDHPVKLAFFPTITISLLLLAAALTEPAPDLAGPIWFIAMLGQGALTLAVITGWISHRAFQVGHLTPAWFIPAVGNVIVPLAGAPLGWTETSWLFFSGGMIFWLVLLALVMNRLVFHDPLPGRLFPTLVILIAPPAVAFISYVRLTGGIDPFAVVLVNVAYVFAALVVVQLPKLARLPFALSWWALSFPLAALSSASFLYAGLIDSAVHRGVGLVVLIALTVAVIGLFARTGLAAVKGALFMPD